MLRRLVNALLCAAFHIVSLRPSWQNKPIKGLYATGLDISKAVGHTYTTWTSGFAFGFACYSGRHAGLNAAEAIK